MAEERGVALIQLLQRGGGSADLMHEVLIDAGLRCGRLGFERSAKIICQVAEAGGQNLLAGNALFEIGQGVAGNGLHGSFELGGERAQ